MDTPSGKTEPLTWVRKPRRFTALLRDKQRRLGPGGGGHSCGQNRSFRANSPETALIFKCFTYFLAFYFIQKFLIFTTSSLSVFFFMVSEVVVLLRKPFSHQDDKNVLLFFLGKQA